MYIGQSTRFSDWKKNQRTNLVLNFAPDLFQVSLLCFRERQLGGDGVALGDERSLLLLRQQQHARRWDLRHTQTHTTRVKTTITTHS